MNDVEIYRAFQQSPIFFIEKMWGLTPERDNAKFVKGKHLTWQQHDILLGVERALRGEGPKRISVASGHGIGKTATLSWLLLWFLFCFKDAQVPVTAPTSDQMHDVLWKEVSLWLGRMPQPIKDLYEWSNTHVRIREAPETWFARAKTARKEAPEALAGVHGDFVLMLVDEASGIPEEVFRTAEGALTNENILVILISNPTRLVGYFYDTHHSDRRNWQTLTFDSEQSAIVDKQFVERIIAKHGKDSDEYRIRVHGQFPREDALDDQGYVPLLSESDLHFVEDKEFVGSTRLGVDPSGEGDDETSFVGRDRYVAKILGSEKISNEKSIAQKTITLMDLIDARAEDVTVDNFGSGANVSREIALAGIQEEDDIGLHPRRVNAVNVGEKADDDDRFQNKRAEAYFRMKEWLRSGGELVNDERWRELLTIRYRRELNGKLKIMSKREMQKAGFKSPNHADAFMLTFVNAEEQHVRTGAVHRPKWKGYKRAA